MRNIREKEKTTMLSQQVDSFALRPGKHLNSKREASRKKNTFRRHSSARVAKAKLRSPLTLTSILLLIDL